MHTQPFKSMLFAFSLHILKKPKERLFEWLYDNSKDQWRKRNKNNNKKEKQNLCDWIHWFWITSCWLRALPPSPVRECSPSSRLHAGLWLAHAALLWRQGYLGVVSSISLSKENNFIISISYPKIIYLIWESAIISVFPDQLITALPLVIFFPRFYLKTRSWKRARDASEGEARALCSFIWSAILCCVWKHGSANLQKRSKKWDCCRKTSRGCE